MNADGSFTGTAVSGYKTATAWATTANKTLYAHWEKARAIFKTGKDVNAKMKQLAGTEGATYETVDTNILEIKRATKEQYDENTDNADICEELIQGESYIKDNIKHPLEISKETIYIKGKKEIEVEIQKTENGRIFGKTVPSAWTLLNQHHTSSLPLSLRIPFMKKNFTSFDFYFKIALAKNENDFLLYKHLLKSPNINLHWVTKDGNMGWDVLGTITVKNYYNRFCHGFSSEDDIIEEVPEKNMLKLHNPKRGYIVSGNNKPASFNYLYELRGHHNNFRAHRIEEILMEYKSNNKKIGIKDANKIVNDVKDTSCRNIFIY